VGELVSVSFGEGDGDSHFLTRKIYLLDGCPYGVCWHSCCPDNLLFALYFPYQARERQRREEQERLEREAAEAERKRKEEEEARERAEREAAEKAAALAKLQEEKALSLGAEPEKGPNVTQVSFFCFL